MDKLAFPQMDCQMDLYWQSTKPLVGTPNEDRKQVKNYPLLNVDNSALLIAAASLLSKEQILQKYKDFVAIRDKSTNAWSCPCGRSDTGHGWD